MALVFLAIIKVFIVPSSLTHLLAFPVLQSTFVAQPDTDPKVKTDSIKLS